MHNGHYSHSMENSFYISHAGIHDVQNVRIDSYQSNEIRVRGDFADQATTTGALLIVYSLNDESDVNYIAVEKSLEQDNVTGLTKTQYGVSVFSLENGLPFHRVVTLSKHVCVNDTEEQNAYTFSNTLLYKSIPPPLVSVSTALFWTILLLTVWQWYINESLSSGVVDW